jgi:hypothetical protein
VIPLMFILFAGMLYALAMAILAELEGIRKLLEQKGSEESTQ